MKILVINGPNLNMLGIREPEIYGKDTYASLKKKVALHCKARGVKVRFFQSNCEGALVTAVQKAYRKADGIVLNPGGYTHTSVALLDALKAVGIPTVEVHISKVDEREAFRKVSYVREACFLTVSGQGLDGYVQAVDAIIGKVGENA